MSEITCPFCNATLFDSELAAGECTSCMQKLPRRRVGSPSLGPTRGGLGEVEGRDWQGVRGGVGVLALAVWATVVLVPLLALAIWVHEFSRWSPGPEAMAVFLVFGLMLCGLVGLVGLVLSLVAPAYSGLRMHTVGSGVGLLMGPLVIASPFVLAAMTRGGIVRQFEWLLILMLLAGIVLELAAWVWYFVYLRGVARWFGDEPLGMGFVSLGIVLAVLAGLGLGGLFFLTAAEHFHNRELEKILFVGSVFASLVLLVWLGMMLVRLYRLIPSVRGPKVSQADV